jgi:transglutaminase-like putative cysteine protease
VRSRRSIGVPEDDTVQMPYNENESLRGCRRVETQEGEILTIRVVLHHKTTYHYDRLVTLSPHIIRLRPAPHCRTPILSYALSIQPLPHILNWQQDPQGNYQARVVFPEQMRTLEVAVDLVANLVVINPFDFFLESSAETFPFVYEAFGAQ